MVSTRRSALPSNASVDAAASVAVDASPAIDVDVDVNAINVTSSEENESSSGEDDEMDVDDEETEVGDYIKPVKAYVMIRRLAVEFLTKEKQFNKLHTMNDVAKGLSIIINNPALSEELLATAFGNHGGAKIFAINCEYAFGNEYKGSYLFVSLSVRAGSSASDRSYTDATIGCFSKRTAGAKAEITLWQCGIGGYLSAYCQRNNPMDICDDLVKVNDAVDKFTATDKPTKKKKLDDKEQCNVTIEEGEAAIAAANAEIQSAEEKIHAAKEDLAKMNGMSEEETLKAKLAEEDAKIEELKSKL